MPFITEDIWHKIRKREIGESIVFSSWPKVDVNSIDKGILNSFNHLFKVMGSIRKIRKEKNISFKQSLSLLVEDDSIFCFKDILKKTCNLDDVDFLSNQKKELFPFLVDKNRYFIPLTFQVDNLTEINRINNEINYLKGFLELVNKKLSNKNFISNAPKTIIVIEEKKKKDAIVKLESLKNQLNSFNGSKSIHPK